MLEAARPTLELAPGKEESWSLTVTICDSENSVVSRGTDISRRGGLSYIVQAAIGGSRGRSGVNEIYEGLVPSQTYVPPIDGVGLFR